MVWMLTGRVAKPEKSHVIVKGENWRFCYLVARSTYSICLPSSLLIAVARSITEEDETWQAFLISAVRSTAVACLLGRGRAPLDRKTQAADSNLAYSACCKIWISAGDQPVSTPRFLKPRLARQFPALCPERRPLCACAM